MPPPAAHPPSSAQIPSCSLNKRAQASVALCVYGCRGTAFRAKQEVSGRSGAWAKSSEKKGGAQGCSAVICMPTTTPVIKVDAVRRLGGDVELHGESYTETQAHAQVRAPLHSMVHIRLPRQWAVRSAIDRWRRRSRRRLPRMRLRRQQKAGPSRAAGQRVNSCRRGEWGGARPR